MSLERLAKVAENTFHFHELELALADPLLLDKEAVVLEMGQVSKSAKATLISRHVRLEICPSQFAEKDAVEIAVVTYYPQLKERATQCP